MKLNVFSLAHLTLIAGAMVALGCAQGGSATAIGDCSQAVGGPAILNVSPALTAKLGEDAIVAAGKAARAFLIGVSGPIGPTEVQQAKSRAVSAAEATTHSPLSDQAREEIENQVEIMARNQARC